MKQPHFLTSFFSKFCLPQRLKFFRKMLTQIPASIRVPIPLSIPFLSLGHCGWIASIPRFCVWLSANEVGRTKIDLTTAAEGKSPSSSSSSPLVPSFFFGLTFCGHRGFLPCYPKLHINMNALTIIIKSVSSVKSHRNCNIVT